MSVSRWRLWQRRQALRADADVKVLIGNQVFKPAADTAVEMKITRRRLPGAQGVFMFHCLKGCSRWIALAWVLVVSAGCVSYVDKSAEGVPASGIATLQMSHPSIVIVEGDGKDNLFWLVNYKDYQFAPGRHRIKVVARMGSGLSFPIIRDVDLLAGHAYLLTAEVNSKVWSLEVRDKASGERVDGPN
jgi:hypothetical protein